MPATYTHARFAMDVYNHLDKKDQKINPTDFPKYLMFSQSMDSMMFYNIESLKKGKALREFQFFFHTHDSRTFFVHLCHIIKKNQLFSQSEVLSFLYGFICHYVLDSNIHPFVIYKTGYFDKRKKETYLYRNLHNYTETYIDNVMIERVEKVVPYSFKIHDFAFDLTPFSHNLNTIIQTVFLDVFGISHMDKIYYTSLRQMKRFLKRYRYDSSGFKMKFYKTIDFFTSSYAFKFQSLSYHDCKNYQHLLNLERKIWYHPVIPSITSHDSFFDLYDKSIQEAVSIISKVNQYFRGEDVSLKEVFLNKSYLSGVSCDIPLHFKKFEK